MGKRARLTSRSSDPTDPSVAAGDTAAVGPRQPCPCGSGRRYKACHGSTSGAAAQLPFVKRPFEGLAAECDLVAMREFVPAATAGVRLHEDPDRTVLMCSLLPMAAPALVRQDGSVWVGLQVQHGFGDPSRELTAVLLDALGAAPGSSVGLTADPGPGPRLQDVLVDALVTVQVHDGFGFWISDLEDPDGSLAASLEQANAAASPTARLVSVDPEAGSAYWTDVGAKEHLRWVMPHDEDSLLTALARLHAAGEDVLVPGSRLVGMFRSHGLLVPVWDLPVGTGAEALEEPSAAFTAAVEAALGDDSALSPPQRAARSGLATRQVTLR